MSHSPFRQASFAWSVDTKQDTPLTAPYNDMDFMTQMEQNAWSSIIKETSFESSGCHHITASRRSQALTSPAAAPIHHPEEEDERAESCGQRQSVDDPFIPHAKAPNDQPSPIKVEDEKAAAEHLLAMDDAPLRELDAAERELLESWIRKHNLKGFPLDVVHQGVVLAAATYFRQLKQDQRDPTRSRLRSTGVIVETIEQDPDLEEHAPVVASDNMRGSHHGHKLPLRDAVDGTPLDTMGSSRPSTSSPDSDEGSENKTDLPSSAGQLNEQIRRRKLAIHDETTFRKALRDYKIETITVDDYVINLVDLARDTVDINRERQRIFVNNKTNGTITDGETWEILFTMFVCIFVFGLENLYSTIEVMRRPSVEDHYVALSSRRQLAYQPLAACKTTGLNKRVLPNIGSPKDGVVGREGQVSGVEIAEDEDTLTRLTNSVNAWMQVEADSSLKRIYSYYDQTQTIRLYDDMTKNKERTIALFEKKGIHLRVGLGVSTLILDHISKEIGLCRGKDRKEGNSLLSDKIRTFRGVYGLVEAFGEGVLLVVGNNQRQTGDWGKANPGNYRHFQRLRHVAMSLKKADRAKSRGQLRGKLSSIFAELHEKVLKPVLRLRRHGNVGNLVIDCPQKQEIEKIEVGKRISLILRHINEDTDTDSHFSAAPAGERPSKRKTSSSGMREAAEGEQGMNKRRKAEPNKDKDSRKHGAEIGTHSGDDLYLS